MSSQSGFRAMQLITAVTLILTLVMANFGVAWAENPDAPGPRPADDALIQECIQNGGHPLACAVMVQSDSPHLPEQMQSEEAQAGTDCVFFQTVVVGLSMNMALEVCRTMLNPATPPEPPPSRRIEQPGDAQAMAACVTSGFTDVECRAIVQGGSLNIGSDPARFREGTDCLFHQTVVMGMNKAAAMAICDPTGQAATTQPSSLPSQPMDNLARCKELQEQAEKVVARYNTLDFLNDPEYLRVAQEAVGLTCQRT